MSGKPSPEKSPVVIRTGAFVPFGELMSNRSGGSNVPSPRLYITAMFFPGVKFEKPRTRTKSSNVSPVDQPH